MINNLDNIYKVTGHGSYLDVLAVVQPYMASLKEFSQDASMTGAEAARYKKHIEACITTNNLTCSEVTRLSDLIDRLYNTMTQFDVLTKYLDPKTFMEQGIEEIYGRWNCIYILGPKGKVRLEEKFPSAEIADNIFGKIARRFNCNLNEGTPMALGEFMPNVRASFAGPPITSPQYGAEFNIRFVHGSKMTREMLLRTKTICSEGLDFLELCVRHKINICIAGATGSGKTGTMYHLLSTVTQDTTYRVGTIEIECREFDLIRYNEDGECVNDVFHWVTRNSDDIRYDISSDTLVADSLRFKADIMGIGEMRNKEALIACELATTGHGVITTTHCSSAARTPYRILQLCKKAGDNSSDSMLLDMITDAFPIIVHQKLEMDGHSRKVYEIAECVGVENGVAKVNNIFEYVVTDNQVAQKITIGSFQKVGGISERLKKRLLDNHAPLSEINKY